jgi:hypothetical protein
MVKCNSLGVNSVQPYETRVGPNDVLMGRGAPIDANPGNVRFRMLIQHRKTEYLSTSRHRKKQEIAQEVKETVIRNGGKFLKKPELLEGKSNEVNTGHDIQAWNYADDHIIFSKIKQALRDNLIRRKERVKSKCTLSLRTSPQLPKLRTAIRRPTKQGMTSYKSDRSIAGRYIPEILKTTPGCQESASLIGASRIPMPANGNISAVASPSNWASRVSVPELQLLQDLLKHSSRFSSPSYSNSSLCDVSCLLPRCGIAHNTQVASPHEIVNSIVQQQNLQQLLLNIRVLNYGMPLWRDQI